MKNKSVLIKGPFFTNTGYGNHARQVYHCLKNLKDIDIKIQSTRWGIFESEYDKNNFDYAELKKSSIDNKNTKKFDISYQVMLPEEWDSKLAKKNVGVTAGIESTFCLESWLKHINQMDNVIVPSEHAKKSILNSFKRFKIKKKTPINIIGFYPNKIFVENLEVNTLEELENLEEVDTHLIVGLMTSLTMDDDRKNIFYTLNSLNKYYSAINEKCNVILKTNIGNNSYRTIESFKEFVKKELFKEYKNINIKLIHGEMSENQMYSLYKTKNLSSFILLTKGECFGIPYMEAALCKIPIIATNWSSHNEFLKESYFKVDFNLIEQTNTKNKYIDKKSKLAVYKEESFFKCLEDLRSKKSINLNVLRSNILNLFREDVIIEKHTKVFNQL